MVQILLVCTRFANCKPAYQRVVAHFKVCLSLDLKPKLYAKNGQATWRFPITHQSKSIQVQRRASQTGAMLALLGQIVYL